MEYILMIIFKNGMSQSITSESEDELRRIINAFADEKSVMKCQEGRFAIRLSEVAYMGIVENKKEEGDTDG